MPTNSLFRLEHRQQNAVQKYYLVREIHFNAHKFTASHLITSGTSPTKNQINRCAALYGFDLELKCIAKASRLRIEQFKYDSIDGGDSLFDFERYRYLQIRHRELAGNEQDMTEFIAASPGCTFTDETIHLMFSDEGILPKNATLSTVNRIQNLYTAYITRSKRIITSSRITRLQQILSCHLNTPSSLSTRQRTATIQLLSSCYRQIRDGFYPFEQCMLVYEGLTELFSPDSLFVYTLYGELLTSFGYHILPCNAVSLEQATDYVHRHISDLERDVRRLTEQKFRVKTGGKQKRLEFFS